MKFIFVYFILDCAVNSFRSRYYFLKGRALNVTQDYSKEAQDLLSKAVKLDPKLIEAWNELGECYWKNDNLTESKNCFTKALEYVSKTPLFSPFMVDVV